MYEILSEYYKSTLTCTIEHCHKKHNDAEYKLQMFKIRMWYNVCYTIKEVKKKLSIHKNPIYNYIV